MRLRKARRPCPQRLAPPHLRAVNVPQVQAPVDSSVVVAVVAAVARGAVAADSQVAETANPASAGIRTGSPSAALFVFGVADPPGSVVFCLGILGQPRKGGYWCRQCE